jgi:hypothetical protein
VDWPPAWLIKHLIRKSAPERVSASDTHRVGKIFHRSRVLRGSDKVYKYPAGYAAPNQRKTYLMKPAAYLFDYLWLLLQFDAFNLLKFLRPPVHHLFA